MKYWRTETNSRTWEDSVETEQQNNGGSGAEKTTVKYEAEHCLEAAKHKQDTVAVKYRIEHEGASYASEQRGRQGW